MGYDDAPPRSRTATRRPNPLPTPPPNRPSPQPSSPIALPRPPADRPVAPPLVPPVVYTPASSPRPGPASESNQAGVLSALAPGQGSSSETGTSARDPAAPIPEPGASSVAAGSANVPPPAEATVSMLSPIATPSVTPAIGDPGTGAQGSPSLFTLPVVVGCLAIVAVSLGIVIAVLRRMRSAKANVALPPNADGNQQQPTSTPPRPSASGATPELAAASIGSATISPLPASAVHPPLPPLVPTSVPTPDSPPTSPTPLSRTTPLGTTATVSATLRSSLAPTNRSRSDVGSVPGTQYSPTLYAQKLGNHRRGSRDSILSASSGTLYYANSRAASTTTVSPTDGSGGVLSDAMSANVVSPPLPPMSPVATSPAMWRLSTGSGLEAYQQQPEQQPVAPWPPLPRTVTLDHLDGSLSLSATAIAGVSAAPPVPPSPGSEVTSEALSTWVRSTFRTDFDTLEHESISGSIRGPRALHVTTVGSDFGGSAMEAYKSDDDGDGGGSILSVPGTPLTDAFSGGAGFTVSRRVGGAPHALALPASAQPQSHSQPLSPLALVEFPPSDGEVSGDSGSLEPQGVQEQGEGAGRAA